MDWFQRRWRGHVPAKRLWWRDMLVLGTALNIAAGAVALAGYGQGMGMVWAMVFHLATLPFNLFLYACLWRAPERTVTYLVMGTVWLFVFVLI